MDEGQGSVRRATHAGTWYPEDREALGSQLQELLHQARTTPGSEVGEGAPLGPGGTHEPQRSGRRLKALIVPYVGTLG
jgi:predicted class III extradiol MEMO1 family dioxygenase